MSKLLFIDIESTGLDWKKDKLHGIAFSYEEGDEDYLAAADFTKQSQLWKDLEDPAVDKVGHNLRFDLRFLSRLGVHVYGRLWDTMTMAQLVDENNSVGLKQLSERYLGVDTIESKRELDRLVSKAGVKSVADLSRIDLEKPGTYFDTIAEYACEDIRNTVQLFYLLGKKLKESDKAWRELRKVSKTPLSYLLEEAMPVENALLRMELRGIKLDNKAVDEARARLGGEHIAMQSELDAATITERKAIENELLEAARAKRKSDKGKARVEAGSERYGTRFLWTSAAHVGKLIYEQYQVPARLQKKTSSGQWSTADADLSMLESSLHNHHPLKAVLGLLSKLRASNKLLSTYVSSDGGLLEDVHLGRVHSNYLQAGSSKDGGKGGTATGRLSSQAPNMQNLPRNGGVKKFFVPDPWHCFLYFDYSQVELRIAAHLSQDPNLLDAYKLGLDLHAITASAVFKKLVDKVSKEERQVGKTLNFAMIYDASAWRLAQELGPLGYTVEDCEEMRRAFFDKYSRYKEYLNEQLKYVQETGCVISETGRVRRLPEIGFGKFLDWRTRSVKAPADLMLKLRQHPAEQLSSQESFERAKKKYKHAVKQAYNHPIQSLGASITKRALVRLHESNFDLVTTVHDSIIVQVPVKDRGRLHEVQQILEQVYPLSVPLKCEGKVLTSLDESDTLKLEAPVGAEGEAKRENHR